MTNAAHIVLYVEDEEIDRLLMQRAFAKCGLADSPRMVADGQEAVDYLSGIGKYAARELYPLPAMVLLDLNLPGLSGFDVLEWIRLQPPLAQLPVVIFSSSERDEDQARAAKLGASEFIRKPGSGLTFQEVVRHLEERWLQPGASSGTPAGSRSEALRPALNQVGSARSPH